MEEEDITTDIMKFEVGDYINISWKFSSGLKDAQYMICRVYGKSSSHIDIEFLFSSDNRLKRFSKFKVNKDFFDIYNKKKSMLGSLQIVSFKKIPESEALSYAV